MDLAHRVGALSPRPGDLTLSNSGNGAGLVSGGGGSAPGSARGGASSNFSPNQSGANVTEGGLLGVRGTGPGPYAAVRSPLERPLSTSPSPTRAEPPGADGVSGSGAESPSTGSRPGSSSGAATYGHAASIKAAVDLAQTRGPAARVPLASMQDIPAFYFPSVANGGRLAHAAAREKALAAVSATQAPAAAAPAPAPSEKQPPSGIIGRGAGWAPPALGAKAAAAAAAAGANAATAAADAAIAQLQQQQQQELASLNRVVAALTAPPAKAKAGSKAGKPKAPPSALSVAVQLTTETFGLPGVFAKIVHARLVQITQQLAAATGAVPAASGGATSKAAAAQFTAAAARAFYESHIIDRTIERRMYDVLLGAGDLNFPVPAASTVQLTFPGPAGAVKAKKGVAPSAAAPGSGRTSLNRGDFSPLLQILLDHHPGLNFLKGTPDFQARYLEAVTIRIFYELDRYDTGRISWEDFRRSTLPAAIRKVDSSEDINAVLEYFSYEHFYVLYCRFWDLDGNKDFLVTKDDLSRYFSENTANPEVVERIVNGVGRPLRSGERGKMNFEDFVWFCLSEENKAHPRAISYFFRILDVDGDGVISGFELEHFYAHTREKMLEITTEAISYEDVTCQIADMMVCAASATVTAAGAGHHGAADGAASIAAGAGARRRSASAPAFPLAALGNTTITSVTSPTEMATTPPPGHRGAQPASTVANGSILHAGYTLADFLRCPQAAYVAINMLTNVSKFLLFEQRDPFVTQEKGSVGNNPEGAAAAAVEKTEWDRFCRTEYDRMAAEDPMS
jgi:Ca2+-binding EF-hand superfamily protein